MAVEASRSLNLSHTETLQVLLDASSLLLASPNESAVLSGILNLASKLIAADAYAVWRAFDGGAVWRAVAERGLSEAYRREIPGRKGESPDAVMKVEDIAADASLHQFNEDYRREGIRSLLVVPLLLRGKSAGTITFYWKRARRFTLVECDAASALANLSAAALNMSELHEQNLREKRRLSFLTEASAVLASSLDYETTLERVAQLAVPHVADWCAIHIFEEGKVSRVVVAHADPEKLAFAKQFSSRYPEEMRDDRGLGAVLAGGRTEVFGRITDEMLVLIATDQEHLEALRGLGLTSSILVPLTSRGQVLGAIRLLAAGGERHFTRDDVQLAEDLARRAAGAIENAQLHRAVLKQQTELRLSHAAARMGTWSWNLVRQQIAWSAEFKALHGLAADAEPSFNVGSSLIHPDDREQVLRNLTETLASHAEQINAEHRVLTPDGRVLWIQSRGRIERNAEGAATSIFGISIDVTESRLAEQALRRTEKLAAAGRLAATVAHEVNNPLEALINLIYLAQHVQGLPEEVAAYLKTAEAELDRMAHIVRQTLGFYRESIHPRRTEIGKLVMEVLDLYRTRATSRSIALTCTVQAELHVHVNGGEIKQVLANLIANALDASPMGDEIQTSVRRVGETVEVAVADRGIGIAKLHRGHLFEPFFTTKADVGTGLGLWVSKGIVEKYQGSIAVTSRTAEDKSPDGTGTTMTVILPLAATTMSA